MPRTTRRRTVTRVLRVTKARAVLRDTAPIIRLEERKARGHANRVIVVRAGREHAYSYGMIARAAGMVTSGVSRIFQGQRTGNISSIEVMAQVLGISTDQLNTFLQTRRSAARKTPVLDADSRTRVRVRKA